MKCPRCHRKGTVVGLMAAFWVPLNDDGTPEGQFSDYESDTELTGELMCSHCDYTWNDDDDQEEGTP